MSFLKILRYPDPRLRSIAKPVEKVNQKIYDIVHNMIQIMNQEDGIGLAATQINIPLQIIVINKIGKEKNNLILINPKIVDRQGFVSIEEGCLSIPEYRAFVPRAKYIKVEAINMTEKKIEIEAESILSICIQHEIDHLIGRLFIDYLSDLKKNHVKTLKIIFAGTSYFSAEHLHALINSQHKVIAVITKPDKKAGRGQKINFSSVKILSEKNKIPLFQPLNLDEKIFQNNISQLHADIMIVVAYGKILPKIILTMFPMGCINVHASLLPRWRGATPIQSAIMHGDKKTGITIIEMNEKIDTGKIIHSTICDILPFDTTYTLSLKLIDIGIKSLLETLKNIINNKIKKIEQNEKNCFLSYKIKKKDGLLQWNKEAITLERLIRAFNPWPICYFKINNYIIKVWTAEVIPINISHYSIGEIIIANKYGIQINTIHHILNIKTLQMPGKKRMKSEQILLSKKNLFNIGSILK